MKDSEAERVALELLAIVVTKAKNGEDWSADLRRLTDMAKVNREAKDLVDRLRDALLKSLGRNP